QKMSNGILLELPSRWDSVDRPTLDLGWRSTNGRQKKEEKGILR
ncbi:hypothetical protein Tco_0485742, partial [Tanacetum coccineum]